MIETYKIIFGKCDRLTVHILKLLRSQGMPIVQLSTVAYSVIIARILYALPAWGGFITSEHKHRINAFLNALNPMDIWIVLLLLMI